MTQSIIATPSLPDTKTAIIAGAATGAIAGFLHGGITGAIKGATAAAMLYGFASEAAKHCPTID